MLEMQLKFVPIGGGNIVCSSKITAVVPNDGRTAEKLLAQAKKTNRFISLTNGRKARCLILMDSGLLFASRLRTETLFKRLEEVPELALKQYKEDTKAPEYHFVEDEADAVEEEEDALLDEDTEFYADEDDAEDGAGDERGEK